jgi:DedD protein
MARAPSDEELQLKKRARRRLIGAIVLVLAAAVVLPMVLDKEPKPVGQDIEIKIPSPESGAFKSKIVPAEPATQSKPAAKPPAAATKPEATPEPQGQPAAPPAAETKPAAAAAVKETPKEKTDAGKKATSATQKAAPQSGTFVVQVAALSDAAKAKQIQQKISGAGIKSYTEIVKTAKGDVTRVRAGPFATRGAAEKARDELKAMGLNGNVAAK